jgi:hypothetical protein
MSDVAKLALAWVKRVHICLGDTSASTCAPKSFQLYLLIFSQAVKDGLIASIDDDMLDSYWQSS